MRLAAQSGPKVAVAIGAVTDADWGRVAMRRQWVLGGILATAAFALVPLRGAAEFMARVSVLPPEGFETQSVQWSALPLGGQDADEQVSTPLAGAWQPQLMPGVWLLRGHSASGEGFETIVTLTPGDNPQVRVAQSEDLVPVAYRCPGVQSCDFMDQASGLAFTLPAGWAAEPVVIGPAGPMGGFFDMLDEGGAYWALNPEDWGQAGPCRPVRIGRLCTFEENADAKSAFEILAPSIRLVAQ
jgi:hypothetical protein